jgi:hypothetical protein
MKSLLKKITYGVFTFSLPVFISSGCEDTFFNANDVTPKLDNPVAANNIINPGNLDEYLLNATFESDVIGSPPNTALPGSPTGDALSLSDPAIKVSSANGQKSVYLFSTTPYEGHVDRYIDFISKYTSIGSDERIVVTWTAVTYNQSFGNEFDNYIVSASFWRLKDSHNNSIARIRLEDGKKLKIYSGGQVFSTTEIFPNSAVNVIRTFTLSVNYTQQTYNLKIVNNDGAVHNENNIPFDAVPANPPSPLLSRKFTFTITGCYGSYRVDKVAIVKRLVLDPNPPF